MQDINAQYLDSLAGYDASKQYDQSWNSSYTIPPYVPTSQIDLCQPAPLSIAIPPPPQYIFAPQDRPQLSPTRSSTSSVPSLASPSSVSSTSSLYTPPGSIPDGNIHFDQSIFGSYQDSYLTAAKPFMQHPSSSMPLQQVYPSVTERRTSTPIMTGLPKRKIVKRPSNLRLTDDYVVTGSVPALQAPTQPIRRSISASPPSAPPLTGDSRSKTVTGSSSVDFDALMRSFYEADLNSQQIQLNKLPTQPLPQDTSSHFTISGVSVGAEDLAILDQIYPTYQTYDNLPASAPAWKTTFDVPTSSYAHMPNFYVETVPVSPAYEHNPFMYQPPTGALLERGLSDNTVGKRPIRPSPKRRVTSAPTISKRKAQSAAQFVNFTSADASKLLSGVAPSGSAKRKRDEEAAAAAGDKRRIVSA